MTIMCATPVLPALDVREAASFWCDTVGFTALSLEEDFAVLNRGGFSLYINQVPVRDVPDNTLLWLRVDDVTAWRQLLVAAGVTEIYTDVSQPAVTNLTHEVWGRDFALRDPAGNCIHFFTPDAA